MSFVLNAQLSVFCNVRIEPDPENITALLTEINKLGQYVLLPNLITGQNIDLAAKQVKNITNLAFVTTDQSCQIVCMDNRIDVTINSNPDNPELSLEESVEYANRVLKIIMDKYSIMGNRLALNTSILSNNCSDSFEDLRIMQKMYVPMDYYKGKEVAEWATRINSRILINIGPTTENLNVITDLNAVEDTAGGNKRILCHADINTLAENTGYRFNWEKLSDFSAEVLKIAHSIKISFEGLESDD